MTIYNQNAVIDKLNQYLKLYKRPLKLKYGYCHGFTLLWLYKMANGQEDWFYNTVKNIVACKSKSDFEEIELDIEKFLSHIEWLQNSDKYVNEIHQLDIDKVMELPRDLSLSFLFNDAQLDHVLEKVIHENKMICLSGPNHTIGVYQKDGRNYIYDSNYNQGKPRRIDNIGSLKTEIIRCLFDDRKLPHHVIPLEINIASDPMDLGDAMECDDEPDKMDLYDELMEEVEDVDQAGFAGITNLYLACESGDYDEIRILLDRNADPNQLCHLNWRPLLVTASKGYSASTRLLLERGADPNLGDNRNYTALYLAAEAGHEETTATLLRFGANPVLQTKNGVSPLQAALKNKQWNTAVLMLIYCNNSPNTRINTRDMKMMQQHKNEISTAAGNIEFHLTAKQKNQLQKNLRDIYPSVSRDGMFAVTQKRRKTHNSAGRQLAEQTLPFSTRSSRVN